MIAYLHKASGKTWTLSIVAKACNGTDFQAAEKIVVAGKREAKAICAARAITPHNF